MGLTLLATTSLPRRFWAEAFITSTHIINALPTPVLNGDNPYARLFKRKPDYNVFKVFSCACYPNLRPYNNNKFDFRSQCSLFLGYSPTNRGYICPMPTGKIIVSRLVRFDETTFPYNENSNSFVMPTVSHKHSHDISPTLTVVHTNTNSVNEHIVSDSNSTTNIGASAIGTIGNSITNIGASATGNIECLPSIPALTNTHPMTTRAKAGIVKPKIYTVVSTIPSPPSCVKEAMASPVWSQAMTDEYQALLKNKTWTLTALPSNASLVGCKWIFKTKLHADGSFQRCKARLVAKGFNQTEGLDYSETFSPVVKPTMIHIVLSHAVTNNWAIRQVDIDNAFLHGDLNERVYIQ